MTRSKEGLEWRLVGPPIFVLLGIFVLCTGCTAANQGAFEKMLTGQSKVVDLTHSLAPGIPNGPEGQPFEIEALTAPIDGGASIHRFLMAETTGTNLEAPARVISSTAPVDRIPPGQLMGYGVVIDVTKAVAEDPGYRVSRSDIEIWESDQGAIPPESFVLILTGWQERWSDPERYQNLDSGGHPVYPGISAEAVDFLIRERRVRALGIDTMSLYAGSGNQAGQRSFLMTGKFHINNLANLDQLPPRGTTIMAVPLKIENGSGAPARVFAIVPQDKTAVEPGKKKVEQGTDSGLQQGPQGGGMGY